MIVHASELHETLEFRGNDGFDRHNFFSFSQNEPLKLSAHEHLPGDMQIPLF